MTTATATATATATLANQQTWQDAVCALIDQYVANGSCFSSGEIARAVRLARPDFRFAVTELGEFVKDLFHQGAIEYGIAGAVQVPRRTAGRSRTPAGTEVFVYAASPDAGKGHDFEVEIPLPAFTPTDLERKRFAAAVAQANAEMIASVHGDGRLCIPRRAFEELSHATGVSIRGGDRIWIGVEAGTPRRLRIYLEQRDGCTAYALQPERGRVRFSAPDELPSFMPGGQFTISVDGEGLRIDLG